MTARRRAVWLFAILIASVAIDQATKAWAHGLPTSPVGCAQPAELLARHCYGVPQPVIAGYWDWELAYNPGAAFSVFASLGATATRIFLSLLGVLATVAFTWIAVRNRDDGGLAKRAGYVLIASCALGNAIDRVRDGAVTDFVRWHAHEHMWPIFNFADAALYAGVILLIIGYARDRLAPSAAEPGR
jgi:signal peptidase II